MIRSAIICPGNHYPRRLGLGGDVAEPDGGEHGDGEVQPVGVRQVLAEVGRRQRGQHDVGAGEQQQEQRDAGTRWPAAPGTGTG